MRLLALFCCLLLIGLLLAADEPGSYLNPENEYGELRNFGKTDDQILAMGIHGWMDFYFTKVAEGSLTRHFAIYMFTTRAEQRNSRINKARAAKLRKLLYDFRLDILGLVENGGKLSSQVDDQMGVDIELAIYSALTGKTEGVPPAMTGPIYRKIDAIDKLLADYHAKGQNNYWGREAAIENLQQLRVHFKAISAEAAKLDRRRSDALLACCEKWLDETVDNIHLNFDVYELRFPEAGYKYEE